MKNKEQNLVEELRTLEKKIIDIRKGARDWKARALHAEARCRELLTEREETARANAAVVEEFAQMMAEADQRAAKLRADLDNAIDERDELKLELLHVKAHAHDLAFGNLVNGEDW